MKNVQLKQGSIASLYVLKAICAFLVVVIHFPMKYGYYLYPIVRIAVPCFFMISGYFLYNDNREKMLTNLKRALRRTLKVTIFAYAFYLLVEIFNAVMFNGGALCIQPHTLLYYLIAGPQIGSSSHLWYMIAYLETLLVALLCVKAKSIKLLWWAIPVGLTLNLLIGKYGFLFPSIDFSGVGLPQYIAARNFITMGIPAFAIGLLLQKNNSKICDLINNRKAWISCILCLILATVEFVILHIKFEKNYMADISLFTIPLAISVIILCLKYPDTGKGKYITTIGKKYSSDIYIYHMFGGNFLIGYTATVIHKITGIENLALNNAPMVFVATLIFVIVLQKSLEWIKTKTTKLIGATTK